MKFQLKAGVGKHYEAGQVYQRGEIVESDYDLAKLFAEKFELIGGDGGELAPPSPARVSSPSREKPAPPAGFSPSSKKKAVIKEDDFD